MKEESLLLLSDLQKLINQVVLIDYTIIILGDESGGLSSPFVYSVTDLYYTRSSSIHFRILEKSMVSSP